jgi:hypothetical protein
LELVTLCKARCSGTEYRNEKILLRHHNDNDNRYFKKKTKGKKKKEGKKEKEKKRKEKKRKGRREKNDTREIVRVFEMQRGG